MNVIRKTIVLLCFVSLLSVAAQDQAIADSLKEIYTTQKFADDTTEMLVLFDIAFYETNPNESDKYADLLITKAQQTENLIYEHRGFVQRGYSKQYQGDYELAFQAFFKGLDLAIKASYDVGIGICYTAIADTYSLTDDSENSMKYYSKGIEVLRQIPDSISLASTLLNAGDEYFSSDQLDSALSYFEESRIIFNKLDYEIGQAYNLGNVGLVYAKQGKYELAEQRLNEASEMLERLGDIYPIAEYNFYISDIYLEKDELNQAISHAVFGYNIAKYYGLKKEIKDGADRLSTLYEKKNKPIDALKYLRESIALEDSLSSTDVIRDMAELQREFDVAQKQAEVDLLNEQKRTQQVIGLGLVIVLFLTGVVVFLLYKTNKKGKKLNHELALINETKTKFFSIISHDLRSPISAFFGINRVINHLIKNKKYQDLESMTDEIDKSVRSISSLLDNLLTWAVQQQGKFSYNPEPLNLLRMIEDNQNLLHPVADIKNIELSNKISSDIMIWADKNSVMTIFRNIMSNAIKFTPEKGEVMVLASNSSDGVRISVIDTGVGISEDHLSNLFEFQAQNSSYGTSGEKGVGLGVQLSYEFTKLNKGSIEYVSKINEGTTVHITLPEYQESEQVTKNK